MQFFYTEKIDASRPKEYRLNMPQKRLGRPKAEKRDRITALVLPETRKIIERLARKEGISIGKALDALLSPSVPATVSP